MKEEIMGLLLGIALLAVGITNIIQGVQINNLQEDLANLTPTTNE